MGRGRSRRRRSLVRPPRASFITGILGSPPHPLPPLWLAGGPGGFSERITGLERDHKESRQKEQPCGTAAPGLWTLTLPELKPFPPNPPTPYPTPLSPAVTQLLFPWALSLFPSRAAERLEGNTGRGQKYRSKISVGSGIKKLVHFVSSFREVDFKGPGVSQPTRAVFS